MDVKKLLGPALLGLLLMGVGTGVYLSATDHQATDTQTKQIGTAAAMATVRGLSGSEKIPFLTDPRVAGILQANGIQLEVRKAGSREIALSPDLKSLDFVFPAGAPGANKVKSATKTKQEFTPFYTPMVIASWKPIANLLEENGIVKKQNGAWYVVDMTKLLVWMKEGKRWKDVPGNSVYPVNKSVLVATTDVRKSNSAAMFLALASYIANAEEVVSSEEAVQKVLPVVAPLFLRQGYQESSTAGPFEDYLSMGMGKAPLVMVYEAQFIEYLAKTPVAQRNPEMVLMYPSPTVFTKHTLVPITSNGTRLGELLTTNPELQKLAAEYGLRINDGALFKKTQEARNIQVPTTLIDVIDPPSYEWMEKMIQAIELRAK